MAHHKGLPSHTEEFGLRKKIIGPFLNWLFFKVLYRKKANWQLIRDDMVLDNKLPDRILTKGIYPERIGVEELKKKRGNPALIPTKGLKKSPGTAEAILISYKKFSRCASRFRDRRCGPSRY